MIQKKYIVAGIVALFIVTTGGSLLYYFNQFKNVEFSIEHKDAQADIKDSSGAVIATVSNGNSLSLRKGETYDLVFKGESFDQAPNQFEVKDDTDKLTFIPNFSLKKLNEILEDEKGSIDESIKSSVTSAKTYTLTDHRLYHYGEWASAAIRIYEPTSLDPEIGNPDSVDIYYIVLKKEDNTWTKKGGPSLVITKPDNPSIPGYILETLNPATPLQ